MDRVELRPSRPEDMPAMKALWQACFGDTEAYIQFFFSNRYRPEESFVLLRQGRLESMLFGLSTSICLPDGKQYRGAYVYALCTGAAARGKGNAQLLLQEAGTYFKGRGCAFLSLTPQEPRLISFFRRCGFTPGFLLRERVIPRADIQESPVPGSLFPVDAETYCAIRAERCAGTLHVGCDEKAAAYQKALSQQSGGDLYGLELKWGEGAGRRGCMAAEYGEEGRLVVKELLLPEGAYEPALSAIGASLPATCYQIRLPLQAGGAEDALLEFGLVFPLQQDMEDDVFPLLPGYPGFAYD